MKKLDIYKHAFDFQVALAKYMDTLFTINKVLNEEKRKEPLASQCANMELVNKLPDQIDVVIATAIENPGQSPQSITEYVFW